MTARERIETIGFERHADPAHGPWGGKLLGASGMVQAIVDYLDEQRAEIEALRDRVAELESK